jgi:hypothetical protein
MNAGIQKIAERLAGTTVQSVTRAKSGGNSQIFRVETPARRFALKAYPIRAGDTRNRADIEWRTLRFLTANGITTVPLPVARDTAGKFLLMEWIDGIPVAAHKPGDIAQATDFIGRTFTLSHAPQAAEFPLASEACLSAAAIAQQIDRRLTLLVSEPTLDRFLDQTFHPLLSKARSRIAPELQYGGDLPPPFRRLIPADFGFHNALRQADGTLRYVDFEYFGWDDPAKLTADFLLHPAMRLSVGDRRNFTRSVAAALPNDSDFINRLQDRLPLFALRWILILLNAFRRDRQAKLSLERDESRELLQIQLAKAEALVEWMDDSTISAATAI